MFCPLCGAWNPDDSKFCGKCGRRIQTVDRSFPPRRQRDAAAQPDTEGAPPGRSGLCLIVLLASILVALGAVAVGVFVLRDRLADIWPRPAATSTAVAAEPTLSATRVPVALTATPLPSPTRAEAEQVATPLPAPTDTATPTPAWSPTPSATPTPVRRSFKLVYRGCVPHAQSLGSVKGQVFDKRGGVIPGAKVRITIDGYDWQSDANPATTNPDGWYEWILQVGQKVKFVELLVDGRAVSFSPQDVEVETTGGCFQRVDFIEQ